MQGVLLVMNGLAIVNNERFLEPSEWTAACPGGRSASRVPPPYRAAAQPSSQHPVPNWAKPPPRCLPFLLADNWGFSQLGNNPMGPSPNALKYQVIGTLHAAAYMRGASRLLPLLLLPWVVLLLLF